MIEDYHHLQYSHGVNVMMVLKNTSWKSQQLSLLEGDEVGRQSGFLSRILKVQRQLLRFYGIQVGKVAMHRNSGIKTRECKSQ